jgi:hypothetical protein
VYLSEQEVGALAADLSAVVGFDHWVLELQSPGLLRMLQTRMGGHCGKHTRCRSFTSRSQDFFLQLAALRIYVVSK